MKSFGAEKLLVNGISLGRKTFSEWNHLGQKNFWWMESFGTEKLLVNGIS